jgi:acetyl-CoA synthetase
MEASMTAKLYPVPETLQENGIISEEQYNAMYKESIENPDKFWGEHKNMIEWYKEPTIIKNTTFDPENVSIKWFEDGQLNVSYNCIDRHLADNAKKTAILWEGDEPTDSQAITYQELHYEVCKLANGLKKLGVKKGDVVAIYMPMVPQAAYAMLACARIGAVHSVIFGGFSPNAIADRINNASAKVVITSDEGRRAGRTVPLKANVDEAIANGVCPSITAVLTHKLTGGDVQWDSNVDVWWNELVEDCSAQCEPEVMDAEDPLFILYTSGSTGQPKGVVHSSGGYALYTAMTFKYGFDYREDDIYWCTADVGWITGHSYMTYGPLINGATQVFFEGVPTYPDVRRIAQVVEKYKVNSLYTAPTAIRALMAHSTKPVEGCDLS